ncbi:hypothetical protein [Streptomyces sp. SID3343]|uniref:hypothetical protein n=1 Tax=Streptomyces sp. SID3343 TaxID=2690260 RepID=UPI00136C5BAA|nr:hypothetical protein [Streptomyces sp. SID3343]MYW03737.1 hypothetical protein [Streptomyces sp. SID3343]
MGPSVPADVAEALGWTGVEWPAIDADALDRMSNAYNVYAGEVDSARMDADTAATALMADNSGPAADAFAGYWGHVSSSQLVGVYNASKELVTGFTNAATEVRTAQQEAEVHLRTLRDKIASLRAEGRLPPDGAPHDLYEIDVARKALTTRFDAMAAKVAGLLRTAQDLGGLDALAHKGTELNERGLEPAAPAADSAAPAQSRLLSTPPGGSAEPSAAPRSNISSALDPKGGL